MRVFHYYNRKEELRCRKMRTFSLNERVTTGTFQTLKRNRQSTPSLWMNYTKTLRMKRRSIKAKTLLPAKNNKTSLASMPGLFLCIIFLTSRYGIYLLCLSVGTYGLQSSPFVPAGGSQGAIRNGSFRNRQGHSQVQVQAPLA